uniref:Uncharacterized protein n=1 Tax=Manihot esculenta TaxID=3983 RepID=A0A2C9VKB1_MANES
MSSSLLLFPWPNKVWLDFPIFSFNSPYVSAGFLSCHWLHAMVVLCFSLIFLCFQRPLDLIQALTFPVAVVPNCCYSPCKLGFLVGLDLFIVGYGVRV